jgi:hypothetical protein
LLRTEDAPLYVQLGRAQLKSGRTKEGLATLHKVLEMDPSPESLSDVAFELSDVREDLPIALEYAEKAVRAEEDASQSLALSNVGDDDLVVPRKLHGYWDTLGWVHFRLGHLQRAEEYIKAAWTISQDPVEAGHLGQVYEAQHKNEMAMQAYLAAIVSPSPRANGKAKTEQADRSKERLHNLLAKTSGKPAPPPVDTGARLSQLRLVKLPRLVPGEMSAEVLVIVSRDPKTSTARFEDVKFLTGPEVLRATGGKLLTVPANMTFPSDSRARVLRRGLLGCYSYSGCSLVLLLPSDVWSVE